MISLFLSCLASAALAQSPVIQISGANFRPMPVALAAPMGEAAGSPQALEFDQALTFDLSAAGIFQLLDRKSFLADAKEGLAAASINFNRWSDVGAESLVKTQLTQTGEVLHGELRLFTVATSKEELKVSHEVKARDARRLAHLFADAVFKYFTHEPGIFQTHIAFSRRVGESKDIWLADWDGHNAVQITNGGLNLLPAVGRDGASVAFTSFRTGKPEIYVQRPGNPAISLIRSGQMMTGVTYSPDGRHIAYSMANGDSTQVWVARADGSDPHALTNTPYFINTSPSWSPDAKQVAFVSNRGGTPQIYIMGVDGSALRRITFQGNYNQTPDWSPRGDLIAFTARDERNAFDIFTVNVESGKVARVTQDQGNNQEPTFSPNGRLLMFMSDRSGPWHLYVASPDGTNQTALPMDKAECVTPSWGP